MTRHPLSILVVDDDPSKRAIIGEWLSGYDVNLKLVDSYERAVDQMSEEFDIVICDDRLCGFDSKNPGTGRRFRSSYVKAHPETIFILYSAMPDRPANCVEFSEDGLHAMLLDAITEASKPKRREECGYMKQCADHEEMALDLRETKSVVQEIKADLRDIKSALVGTLDNPSGIVGEVRALVEWRQKIASKMWGWAGGVVVGAGAALIIIVKVMVHQ